MLIGGEIRSENVYDPKLEENHVKVLRKMKPRRHRNSSRKDKSMYNISFAVALIGVAGMVGGIENGSTAGIILSAVIYACGIAGMVAVTKKEREREKDENQKNNGAASNSDDPVDKPSGQSSGRQTEDC